MISKEQINIAVIKAKERFDAVDNISVCKYSCCNDAEKVKKKNEERRIREFLVAYDKTIKVIEVCEKPDFILSKNNSRIGVELISITSKDNRKIWVEKLFGNVEKLFSQKYPSVKYLVNFYIKETLEVSRKTIDQQKEELFLLFEQLYCNGEFKKEKYYSIYINENSYFENEIRIQKHSQFNLCPNFGADYCFESSGIEINDIIEKKQKKIKTYKRDYLSEIWLLIEIDTQGKKGFQEMPATPENVQITAKNDFDKIFIFDHFGRCLQLK